MTEDRMAGMVVEQEALELHQDLEIPRFIRRTFQRGVAGNLIGVHRALCELAAAGGFKEGEWGLAVIQEASCMSQKTVSYSLTLLEQYGFVRILARRNDQGHKLKPVIKLVNMPRIVEIPMCKSAHRDVGPMCKSAHRDLGDTTTGSGVVEKKAQVENAYNMVGLEPKVLSSKESAGGTPSPAHTVASPKGSETNHPPKGQRAQVSAKYFMLPEAREDWAVPWEAAHQGHAAYWTGKEVKLWNEFSNSGVDRGTRKLMVLRYLADRSDWTVQNKHPLSGLVKNGPRYQKAAEDFLTSLGRNVKASKPAAVAVREAADTITREQWLEREGARRALGLPPDQEPDFRVVHIQ